MKRTLYLALLLLALPRVSGSDDSDRVAPADKTLAAPFGVPSRIMTSDWMTLKIPLPHRSEPLVVAGEATVYFFPECELTIIRAKDGPLQMVGAKVDKGLTEEMIAHLKNASGCNDDPDAMTMLPSANPQRFFAIRRRLLR